MSKYILLLLKFIIFSAILISGQIVSANEGIKTVKYSVLYMKAVKCLQEAIAKIETLETKVAALEAA